MNWKRLVITHYVIVFMYVCVNIKLFGSIPFKLTVTLAVFLTIFTSSCASMAKIIKEMLHLLKENKELIHTIKTILQLFPEGVMIRSLDPISLKCINKFVNEVVQRQILSQGDQDSLRKTKVTVQHPDKEADPEETSLHEFLTAQEEKLESIEDN